MPRDLTGKVIVITGASSGIGAATAIECAKAGMNIVLNARRRDKLEAVAEQVRRHLRYSSLKDFTAETRRRGEKRRVVGCVLCTHLAIPGAILTTDG